MNIEGLIPLAGGIYALLLAHGILPKNPKDPEKMEAWRKKYGRFIKALSPIVILFGLVQLFGII